MADETTVVVSKIENTENPFNAEGELSQKASYIISHSTITRTEIHIADPDNLEKVCLDTTTSPEKHENESHNEPIHNHNRVPEEVLITSENSQQQFHKPKDMAEPQSIQVEVGKGNASMVVPQRAEEVKLKKGKKCCKGCSII